MFSGPLKAFCPVLAAQAVPGGMQGMKSAGSVLTLPGPAPSAACGRSCSDTGSLQLAQLCSASGSSWGPARGSCPGREGGGQVETPSSCAHCRYVLLSLIFPLILSQVSIATPKQKPKTPFCFGE